MSQFETSTATYLLGGVAALVAVGFVALCEWDRTIRYWIQRRKT